jgi:hypothetical protein
LVFLAINPVFSSSDKIINLGFKDLIINTVSDLKILLEDKNINQKYIITKNTKIINNYLNLNNLEDVVVLETSLNNLKSFKVTRIPNPSPDRREENRENIVICDDNISRIFVKKRIKRSLSENLDLALQIKK